MRRTLLVALASGVQACWSAPLPPVGAVAATPRVQYGSDHAATISDALGFLPADAEVVFSIDAGRLRQSSLWQVFEARLFDKLEPTLGAVRGTCGFDPLADLQSITMGASKLDATMSGTLVVRGLDRAKVTACLKKSTVPKNATFDGEHLMYHSVSSDIAFQFIDASTAIAVFGENLTVADLTTAIRSGAPLRSASAFAALLDEIDSQRAIWLILYGDMKAMQNLSPVAHPEALLVTVDLGDALIANAHLRVDTAAAATQVVSSVQSNLGAVKMMFERFDVAAVDRDIVIDLAANETQVTQMLAIFGVAMPVSQPMATPMTP